MTFRTFAAGLAVAACALGASMAPTMASAADAVPGLTIDPGTGHGNNLTLSYTFGWKFDVTITQTLLGLGAFDHNEDGFLADHAVGLWDADGNLLVSAVVSSDDTLIDRFRFTSVTPLKLLAGQSYVVGAYYRGTYAGDLHWRSAGVTTAPGINHAGARFGRSLEGWLNFPDLPVTTAGYHGGNILLGSATPEPAGWALMLMGFGSAGYMIRRRRAQLSAA